MQNSGASSYITFIGGNNGIAVNNGSIGIETAGDYYHLGSQGLTVDGHSGGILTDADEADAHTIEIVEMYL